MPAPNLYTVNLRIAKAQMVRSILLFFASLLLALIAGRAFWVLVG
jgi:hypothetical protein